jgi:iron complex transport system substrate-binding protein
MVFGALVFALRGSVRLSAAAEALEHDPSRLVAVGGAVTEIVYALGAGEHLVGVDTSSTYPEAATTLPHVGYQRALSAEGVLSLRPSFVLSTWTEILACFEQGSPGGIAGYSSEKMYKNICPGT